MANELRADAAVWVIDTEAAVVTTDTVAIAMIRWVGDLTEADAVELTGVDAAVVWEDVVDAAGVTARETVFPNTAPLVLTGGFGVPTLDGGKLYVHLARTGLR